MPRVLGEPRNRARNVMVVRVQLTTPNPGSRIFIVSGFAQNGNYLHLSNAFVDYISYHYQISQITVYSSRNYTAVSSTDTDKNILIDMSVQPFTGWTTSPSSISDFAGNREGLESSLRICDVLINGHQSQGLHYPF